MCHSHKELESTINNDLYKVKEYFDTNKLSLNVPKCEFMLVGTYQSLAKFPDIRIHINNEPLKQVTVSKYLGMKIDSNLKWDDHINAFFFLGYMQICAILRQSLDITLFNNCACMFMVYKIIRYVHESACIPICICMNSYAN